MSGKFTAFLKRYYPVTGFLIFMLVFLFLSEAPEADASAPYISHSFIIETYLLETETETLPVSGNSSDAKNTQPETTEPETLPPEPPESVILEDVPYYSQENILPTGCEIVSAKMLLEYYTHQETDVYDLIDLMQCQYPQEIDGQTYAPHPENAFIGDPEDDSSFGCFAPIIVKTLNQLLPEAYQAADISGKDLQEIAETYLPQGKPVLIWATICMWEPFPNVGWYLLDETGNPTDIWYDWLANEHCMVLVGYDADYYYFNDPYDSHGLISYGREKTEQRFEQIGKYAAVVTEKEK